MTDIRFSQPKVRWAIGALVLIVAPDIWLSRSDAAPTNKPTGTPTVPVTMAVATAHDVDTVLDAIGTVTPVATVTITSRVAGVLEEVHYTEGQMVKKNDPLAVIDPRPYAAALAQAKGQLARDEAQLANARLDLQRYRSAVEQHAVPEQQAAAQAAAVHAGEGTVQFDRGVVDTAQINLDYTHIVSPIDGRVGLRMVDPGNNVAANGTSGLVTVTQLEPIAVVFTLSQEFLPKVLAGMRAGTPLRVEAFDRSSAKAAATGELLTIDNQIDQTTGTFRLKATFPNQDTALWPGEFVNLRFTVGVHKDAVTVPSRAVQRGPDGNYVYVIKPDMTVALRNVETTTAGDGVTVIDKGVRSGEHVVLDGQYRLEEGTKVVVQPAADSVGKKTAAKETEY
jgi:membrane fusion protein, multidrug efflux system